VFPEKSAKIKKYSHFTAKINYFPAAIKEFFPVSVNLYNKNR